MNKYKANTLK